ITGSFEGLKSPATIAQIHKSPVRGVRGPVVSDLVVTKTDASGGTLSGALDLTPLQVTDLEKGLLYIQVHSEKARVGNLWGCRTPQEAMRCPCWDRRSPRSRCRRRSVSCCSRVSSRRPPSSPPRRWPPAARSTRPAARAATCPTSPDGTKRR